jgi:hypothetical protein
MLALEPPGNVAGDLASFRRALFSDLGEGSSLLLPEVAPLAIRRLDPAAARPRRAAVLEALDEAWEGVEGAFSSGPAVLSRGLAYLELRGPTEDLASRAAAAMSRLKLATCPDSPLEAGRGFLLCRLAEGETALERPPLASPPRLAFRDCSLILLGLRFGADPFASATWRELARSKRRTGPTTLPSRRKPR